MYEGQLIICQDVIEEHWLEFLAFVKKRTLEEKECAKKRQEALRGLEGDCKLQSLSSVSEAMPDRDYYYYDVSINSFWNWYITNKI